MNNKQLFINTYLEKIATKFNMKRKDGSLDFDQAFEVFSIAALTDKTFDEVYADIIVKGSKDGGIDGVLLREQDNYYVLEVFQCKNSQSLKQKELDVFKEDFSEVFIRGRRDKPNTQGLLPKLDEYLSITKAGYRIEHKLIFVFNGSKNDPEYAANNELYNSYNKPRENFSIYDSDDLDRELESLIKAETKRESVSFSFNAEKSNLTGSKEPQALISYSLFNVKAVNFRLKATELCKLIEKEIDTNGTEYKLFSENIRGFLGPNKTNKKIKETLESRDSIYFPFLNNGITIIAEEVQVPTSMQAGIYVIPTVNPVIVNGLQTSKVIHEVYKEDKAKLDDVYVTIRLYETKEPDLIDKITEATNTQSPINYSDKISNKKFNDYVRTLFENKNITYLTKRGESFTNTRAKQLAESVSSEKALKFWYATYYEKPETAKNSVSRVVEEIFDATNQENQTLEKLFNGNKESPVYLQIYNSYLIMKYVINQRNSYSGTEDFIEHADELLSYGIYKYLRAHNLPFNNEDILQKGYEYTYSIINENVLEEKGRREKQNITYSHSSYFKKPQCRIDYNKKAGIIESDTLSEELGQY